MLSRFQSKQATWHREVLRNKGYQRTVVVQSPEFKPEAVAAIAVVRLLREQGCEVIYQSNLDNPWWITCVPKVRPSRGKLKPDIILTSPRHGILAMEHWVRQANERLAACGIQIPKIHNCRVRFKHGEFNHSEPVVTDDLMKAVIAVSVNTRVCFTGKGADYLLNDQGDWKYGPADELCDLSAIVPLYKPDIKRVNKCLDCILPQVDEVVLVPGADSPDRFPGLMHHPKIRMVRGPRVNMGYARKANFGARHAYGRYLWLANDDMYAESNVARICVNLMKGDPKIGAVTHTLFYPNGLVQYAGKYRVPGATNFGHSFWKEKSHPIKEPVEQESFCAASVFFNRRAFFDVGGFSDRWYMYCDDDSCALRLRRGGYKVMFEPRAKGIHEEHVTAKLIPDWEKELQKSGDEFARVWGPYFMHNPDVNQLGSFDRVPEIFD